MHQPGLRNENPEEMTFLISKAYPYLLHFWYLFSLTLQVLHSVYILHCNVVCFISLCSSSQAKTLYQRLGYMWIRKRERQKALELSYCMFSHSFASENLLVKTELSLKSKTQTWSGHWSERRMLLKQSSREKQNILQDGTFWIPLVLQTN